jgi:hypothetical protein
VIKNAPDKLLTLTEDIKELSGWRDGFVCAKGNSFDAGILETAICHLYDYQELLETTQSKGE